MAKSTERKAREPGRAGVQVRLRHGHRGGFAAARVSTRTIVRLISAKKNEPEWLLEWRLKALRRFLEMLEKEDEPTWAKVDYPKIDYQKIIYYSAPKQPKTTRRASTRSTRSCCAPTKSSASRSPSRSAYQGVAVDAVFDSVSVATTFKGELEKQGIIFCSFSEAVQEHPDLVKKYLGSVVPYSDNFFATLNSAVFSDGSFATSRRACAARWSSPPTSASTPQAPDSSSAP